MYVAKITVKGFSPYTYLCNLAARCSRLCDGMPGLGLSLNKDEIIWVYNISLRRLLYRPLEYRPCAYFGLLFEKNLLLNGGEGYWVRFTGLQALAPVLEGWIPPFKKISCLNWGRGGWIPGNPFRLFHATISLLNKPKFMIALLLGVIFIPDAILLSLSHKKLCVLGFNLGLKLWGGFGLPEWTLHFIEQKLKKLYFHDIILNFRMRINETFSLCYVEVGVRVDLCPSQCGQ